MSEKLPLGVEALAGTIVTPPSSRTTFTLLGVSVARLLAGAGACPGSGELEEEHPPAALGVFNCG